MKVEFTSSVSFDPTPSAQRKKWPLLSESIHCQLVTVPGSAVSSEDPAVRESRVRDGLVVVVTIDDLRPSDVQVSRELSWERTARETLKVLEEAALRGARPSVRCV